MSSEEESIDMVLAELVKNMNDQILVTAIVRTATAKAFRAGTSRELTVDQMATELSEATITAIEEILELLRQRETRNDQR